MEDSKIIWKYLERAFPNDSLAINIYCTGSPTTNKKAIETILNETNQIFCPAMDIIYLKIIITSFFDMKKKNYKNGTIKLVSIF